MAQGQRSNTILPCAPSPRVIDYVAIRPSGSNYTRRNLLKYAHIWREVRVLCVSAVVKMTDLERSRKSTSSPGKAVGYFNLIIIMTRFTH